MAYADLQYADTTLSPRFRVIDGIARHVHRGAIWQVADIVHEEGTRQWRASRSKQGPFHTKKDRKSKENDGEEHRMKRIEQNFGKVGCVSVITRFWIQMFFHTVLEASWNLINHQILIEPLLPGSFKSQSSRLWNQNALELEIVHHHLHLQHEH